MGTGVYSTSIQKRRYLPRSFAIMTNVRRRQRKKKKLLSLANGLNRTTHAWTIHAANANPRRDEAHVCTLHR